MRRFIVGAVAVVAIGAMSGPADRAAAAGAMESMLRNDTLADGTRDDGTRNDGTGRNGSWDDGFHAAASRGHDVGCTGSLLALGGTIDMFSRSVSIRFDPEACQRTISEELQLPPGEMPPSLRMAEVISFENEAQRDKHLVGLGSWATTVLRAEIKAEGLEEHLLQELKSFPREFVLFLPVRVSMELELGDGTRRSTLAAPPSFRENSTQR